MEREEGRIDSYEVLMDTAGVPEVRKAYYRKWLAEYYRFCGIRGLAVRDEGNLALYLDGMVKQGRAGFQVSQARAAVLLDWERVERRSELESSEGEVAPLDSSLRRGIEPALGTDPVQARPTKKGGRPSRAFAGEGKSGNVVDGASLPGGLEAEWIHVLHRVEEEVRLRHYSPRTLKAYRHWTRAFAQACAGIPPGGVEETHAKRFLASMAARGVSAATQNQAFSAVQFLFVNVWHRSFEDLAATPRAPHRVVLPGVLRREEVQSLLGALQPPFKLLAQVLYGCGLRLNEGLGLRIRDLDLRGNVVRTVNAKGNKSRAVPLPRKLAPLLEDHLKFVRGQFEEDLRAGYSGAFLPRPLAGKLPGAARDWSWQWVFPGKRLTPAAEGGGLWRYHLHETSVQKEIKRAAKRCGMEMTVTPHTFRHSYATHLLQMGYDIRTVQDLLGHSELATTMIYTHVVQALSGRVMSPLDTFGEGGELREPRPSYADWAGVLSLVDRSLQFQR